MVKRLLGGIAALLAAIALWFRSQRDRARAKRANDHADRQAAAVRTQDNARKAVEETRERQAAEREEPDTDKRDDLEGGW